MDPCDEIRRLLRLKRYELPPPDYYESVLHEFRRRRRDELLRQPRWRVFFESALDFLLWHNFRPLAYSSVGVAAVAAGTALISITIHQQSKPVQVVAKSSPVPSTRPANADGELHFASPGFIQPFDMQPTLLPDSRGVPDSFRSDQFVPLKLERVMRGEPFLDAPSAFTGLE